MTEAIVSESITTHEHRCFLNEAFANILGKGTGGTVVFVRCLDSKVILELIADETFDLESWDVRAVSAQSNGRTVTADQAVEIREDKDTPTLLLIDSERAGAGMDGIYSASREINESTLLKEAIKIARKKFCSKGKKFATSAIRRARKVGERNSVSLWREFDFYAAAISNTNYLPRYVGRLGLWPIDRLSDEVNEEDLDISSRMVERLLLDGGFGSTVNARIKSLMLADSDEAQKQALKRFLTRSVDTPTEEALVQLEKTAPLMIGSLKPEFSSQELLKIELKTWRTTSNKVAKWSGLSDGGDTIPSFHIDPDATSTKQYSKLEIRWETKPEDIVAGSVDYRVTIEAGDEELASRTVSHTSKSPQIVRFTNEDFEDLDHDSKFEANVKVVAIGSDTVEPVVTEDFLLEFGQTPERVTAGSGRRVRSMVEGIIWAKTEKEFIESCDDATTVVEDRQGFITFRPKAFSGTSSRVHRPAFLKLLEENWSENNGTAGRWVAKVRSDGTRVGNPVFEGLQLDDETELEKLNKQSEKFCKAIGAWTSSIGRAYCGNTKVIDDYVNTWTAIIEKGDRKACLANTVEIQTMSGQVIGLIVLPTHPVRVAWQTAYDRLVSHCRFTDELGAKTVLDTMASLDSSHFPFALPGLDKESSFIFADALGFHCVAMVLDSDREPKAAIAQMATCLSEGKAIVSPSVGTQMSNVISRELQRYLDFHAIDDGRKKLLQVNSLRPGDGATISKALGLTLQNEPTNGEDEEGVDLCFVAEFFPADSDSEVTGTYLSNVVERNRTGSSGVSEDDKWIVESVMRPGGVSIPRLRWARRDYGIPKDVAHVSVVFDAFGAKLKCVPLSSLPGKCPIHSYGLTANLQRQFSPTPTPTWKSFVPKKHEGEKHPQSKVLTDKLIKAHNAVLSSVTANLGYDDDYWPVVQTEMSADHREELVTLHKQSDWVITVDRNAGIEFFDSPLDSQAIYDAYVIDCVPERSDLTGLQLITSTIQSDEIRDLLDNTLGKMGLSTSLRNCQFLLSHLKALSGRLAIRLSSQNTSSGELIGLALLHAACRQSKVDSAHWLPLERGFFVPLDDVIDLVPTKQSQDPDNPQLRADLLYVGLPSRGSIYLSFVEVKYRRHLRMARDLSLIEKIQKQVKTNRDRWTNWFFGDNGGVANAIRRSNLGQVLQFYLDKAHRHYMDDATHAKFQTEIGKLLTKGNEYRLSEPSDQGRGFVFCPELNSMQPVLEPTTEGSEIPVYLFGPSTLPDFASASPVQPVPQTPPRDTQSTTTKDETKDSGPVKTENASSLGASGDAAVETEGAPKPKTATPLPGGSNQECMVTLGKDRIDGASVDWRLSIASNPHLMLVGLPGMGKTTALLSVCDQLIEQGITPIIFSYHQDIDERMRSAFESTQIFEPSELGFNPMQVSGDSSLGHIDNAGQLRDIFGAMYPDLGDIQLDKIRKAIKDSYITNGWGQKNLPDPPATPQFREFFQVLSAENKPDRGLIARLGELDDYGVFSGRGKVRSLLDLDKPTILKIHATQNENVQRAFAMLAFYNIYKEMFQRGPQEEITHAVVFDEAHRASRMKLLPTFAKESRKYGISLLVSSQEAKDFDTSLFSAIANYALLRLTEADARQLAKNITTSNNEKRVADRLKTLTKYQALFFSEGDARDAHVELRPFEK